MLKGVDTLHVVTAKVFSLLYTHAITLTRQSLDESSSAYLSYDSFKRKDRAKTLGHSSSVPIAPDRTIDPALLFQRFIVVSQTGDLSIQEVMKHELSQYPPALFEARHIFREADKPQIATSITEHASCVHITSGEYEVVKESAPKTDHYVLDGGSLLRRVPWKAGDRYG